MAESAPGPIALWDFQQVQERLTADALQPIKKVNLAANALQREPPRVERLGRGKFSLCFSQSLHERRHNLFLSCSVKTLSQGHSSAHRIVLCPSLILTGPALVRG